MNGQTGSGPRADLRTIANGLASIYEAKATDADGRIRVEDLLSAASAACGEACIAAAGELDPEHHDFTPGSVVMSDHVNAILSNDNSAWDGAGESVFGLIRTGALASGFTADEVPSLVDVYQGLAAGVGSADAKRWGSVPLTIPTDNWPRIQPLRDAYELRPAVRALFRKHNVPTNEWPTVCALALVVELGRVRDAIDHRIALLLVLETVNGMAKTAPMTDEVMRQATG